MSQNAVMHGDAFELPEIQPQPLFQSQAVLPSSLGSKLPEAVRVRSDSKAAKQFKLFAKARRSSCESIDGQPIVVHDIVAAARRSSCESIDGQPTVVRDVVTAARRSSCESIDGQPNVVHDVVAAARRSSCESIDGQPIVVRGETTTPSNPLFHVADDYEPVPLLTLMWVSYVSLVCGCINALSGLIFGMFVTHLTGTTTRFSIGVVDSNQEDRIGFSAWIFFGVIICYSCGAFCTGLLVSTRSVDGKWSYAKFSHPCASGWRWQHQLLLSLSMASLAAAHAASQGESKGFKKSPSIITGIMLTAYAAAILNGFLSLNKLMLLRASHHTGTIHDLFYLLGFSARARNCRFMWKVKLLSCSYTSFIAGCCIGASVFYSKFQTSAFLVPFILLLPVFFLGTYLLWIQYTRRDSRSAASFDDTFSSLYANQKASLTSSTAHCGIPVLASIISELNLHRHLQILIDGGLHNLSLADLSALNPEAVSHNYGMDSSDAAAFIGACRSRVTVAGSSLSLPSRIETGEIDIKHLIWVFYLSFVGGCVNAASLQGIFEMTMTHATGLTTRLGIDVVYPRPKGYRGYSADEIVAVLAVFCFASFVCGWTLTGRDGFDQLQHLKLDYPSPTSWLWNHQFILSLSCLCFMISHILFDNASGGNKQYIDSIIIGDGTSHLVFFEACLLSAAGVIMLNCFLAQSNRIACRATHVTGSIHDVFLGLGFSVRSKSFHLMWRVRLLGCSVVGFFAGGAAGSAFFMSDAGHYSILLPISLIAPVWFLGLCFLVAQYRPIHWAFKRQPHFMVKSDDRVEMADVRRTDKVPG